MKRIQCERMMRVLRSNMYVVLPFVVACLLILPNSLVAQQARTAPETRPSDCPPALKVLLGDYFLRDTVTFYEEGGTLFMHGPVGRSVALRQVRDRTFKTGSSSVVFDGTGTSHPSSVMLGQKRYTRRVFDGEDGKTFTITPLLPYETLLARAQRARPPKEDRAFKTPDLVEIHSLDSSVHYDIRYATTNNFMKQKFYALARAYMQRPAAEALVRAHRWLRQYGLGLLIHDAYRPWLVTKMFWDATPENMKDFVANPATGSRHNRGCAVDVTLYDLKTGNPIDMVSGYDEFSERSYPDYAGGTSLQRWHRALLREAFEREGFSVYYAEWWHFDYRDWRKYRIGETAFEDLEKR